MSRYRIKLVPGDVFPSDPELGIHLQPERPQGESPTTEGGTATGCAVVCPTGWGVTINDVASTGDVHTFVPDIGFTAVVTPLDGMELCGGCLEWEVRKLSQESTDALMDEISVEADGCEGATVTGTGDSSYDGLWFGLFPTLDGVPFCAPIIFRAFQDCINDFQAPTLQFGTVFNNDSGLAFCDGTMTTECAIDIAHIAGTICPTVVVTWDITQTAGTSGNGEQIVNTFSPPSAWTFELQFTSIIDLSGSSFDAVPSFDGIPHPELTVTFTSAS